MALASTRTESLAKQLDPHWYIQPRQRLAVALVWALLLHLLAFAWFEFGHLSAGDAPFVQTVRLEASARPAPVQTSGAHSPASPFPISHLLSGLPVPLAEVPPVAAELQWTGSRMPAWPEMPEWLRPPVFPESEVELAARPINPPNWELEEVLVSGVFLEATLIIDETGVVSKVEINRSMLDEAHTHRLAAQLGALHFYPAMKDGRGVASYKQIQLSTFMDVR